jgi:hypothetical protein
MKRSDFVVSSYEPDDPSSSAWNPRNWTRRIWLIIVTVIVVIVVVVVGTVVGVRATRNGDSGNTSYPDYFKLNYTLIDTYSSTSFFDKFDYFSTWDPGMPSSDGCGTFITDNHPQPGVLCTMPTQTLPRHTYADSTTPPYSPLLRTNTPRTSPTRRRLPLSSELTPGSDLAQNPMPPQDAYQSASSLKPSTGQDSSSSTSSTRPTGAAHGRRSG